MTDRCCTFDATRFYATRHIRLLFCITILINRIIVTFVSLKAERYHPKFHTTFDRCVCATRSDRSRYAVVWYEATLSDTLIG